MKAYRQVTGRCGTCPTFGGVVVECLGEWFGSPQNLISPLQIVASYDPKVYRKYGFRKYSTRKGAEAYAYAKKAA